MGVRQSIRREPDDVVTDNRNVTPANHREQEWDMDYIAMDLLRQSADILSRLEQIPVIHNNADNLHERTFVIANGILEFENTHRLRGIRAHDETDFHENSNNLDSDTAGGEVEDGIQAVNEVHSTADTNNIDSAKDDTGGEGTYTDMQTENEAHPTADTNTPDAMEAIGEDLSITGIPVENDAHTTDDTNNLYSYTDGERSEGISTGMRAIHEAHRSDDDNIFDLAMGDGMGEGTSIGMQAANETHTIDEPRGIKRKATDSLGNDDSRKKAISPGLCSVCHESLETKPMVATECGHITCNECMQTILSGGPDFKCPNCWKDIRQNTIRNLYF